MRPTLYFALLLLLGMGWLFLDFFSKGVVQSTLPIMGAHLPHTSYGGIGVFHNLFGIDFSIDLVLNKGAAWGLLSQFQTWLVAFRIVVIVALLVYLFFFNVNRAADVPLILIVSGALGNVIDYFLYGHVIDFLHFNFWGYDFPIFNLADVAISIGVSWLFLLAIFSKKRALQK